MDVSFLDEILVSLAYQAGITDCYNHTVVVYIISYKKFLATLFRWNALKVKSAEARGCFQLDNCNAT